MAARTLAVLNQPDLFSGPAMDLRAFWPAPGSQLEGAPPSDEPCVIRWKSRWRGAEEAKCNSKQTFWYQVNHIRLSLCLLHAKRMSKRKGVVVTAAN